MIPTILCAQEYRVFFGTYNRENDAKGIYVSDFNADSGELSPPQRAVEVDNPYFLTLSKKSDFLYAVGGEKKDFLFAYHSHLDKKEGVLESLNSLGDLGRSVCHLTLDASERFILTAHYGSHEIALFSLKPDGSIEKEAQRQKFEGKGPNAQRQDAPHPHGVLFLPGTNLFYVPDLGTDRIMIYRLDAEKSAFAPNDPPFVQVAPGSGPRHMSFHPYLKVAYVVNELSNTVCVFSIESNGGLKEIQTISTLPKDWSGENTAAEVAVEPFGRFLYASNRGHDSVARFKIANDGTLTFLETTSVEGKTPRHFALDPSGKFLIVANQDSNNITLFRVEEGAPKFIKALEIPAAPVCVAFAELHKIEHLSEETTTDEAIRLDDLIRMRLEATTLRDVGGLAQRCFDLLENPETEKEIRPFLAAIAENAVLQQAEVVVPQLSNLGEQGIQNAKGLVLEMRRTLEKVLKHSPQSIAGHLYYALILEEERKINAPKDERSDGASQNDGAEKVRYSVEALEHLEQGLELAFQGDFAIENKDIVTQALLLKTMWLCENNIESAIQSIEKIQTFNPEAFQNLRTIYIQLLAKMGDDSRFCEEIEKQIAEAEKDPTQKKVLFELRRLKMLRLIEQQKFEGALEVVQQLREDIPENNELAQMEFMLLGMLGRRDEALERINALIEREPISSQLYLSRAKLFYDDKNVEKALEDLEKCAVFDPSNMEAYLLKWDILQKEGRVDEAIKDAEKLASENPDDFEFNFGLVLIFVSAERYGVAVEHLEKMNEKWDFASVFDEKADANSQTQDTQTADDNRARARRFYLVASDCYLNIGNRREAKDCYEKLLRLAPDYHLALNNLAWIMSTAPEDDLRSKDAVEFATKACELHPDPGYFSTLAAAYAEAGDFEKALEIIQKAIDLAKEKKQDEMVEALLNEKSFYDARKPFREPAEAEPQADSNAE
ncbi:MAG: beta-propeller fold lactonase family protein [Planctomycetia bacterium]|nr:beta-propeller fold lactonase family protein [Planctomycetia bacterium]